MNGLCHFFVDLLFLPSSINREVKFQRRSRSEGTREGRKRSDPGSFKRRDLGQKGTRQRKGKEKKRKKETGKKKEN